MLRFLYKLIFAGAIILGQQNTITIYDQTIVGGDTLVVEIDIENTDAVAGFQFDLEIPPIISYVDTTIIAGRFDDHQLEIQASDSIIRVLAFSPSLSPLIGNTGTVLTLMFLTEPILETFELSFIDPVLGNANFENILTGFSNALITLDTPVPEIEPFSMISIYEDSSFVIYGDTLYAHVDDVDTPLDDISFELTSGIFSIVQQGENFLITPPENWFGIDTILVKADDGFYYDTEPWVVEVLSVNDAPVLSSISQVTFDEDSSYVILLNEFVQDIDHQFSELEFLFNSDSEDINIDINVENNEIIFSASEHFYTDGVTVEIIVSDLQGGADTTDISVIVFPINDAPVISAIPSISMEEDSSVIIEFETWFPYVIDVDNEDNELIWSFDNNVNINIVTSEQDIAFVPASDWYGSEFVLVTVSDGSLTDSFELEIQVSPVNDAPSTFDLLQPDNNFIV